MKCSLGDLRIKLTWFPITCQIIIIDDCVMHIVQGQGGHKTWQACIGIGSNTIYNFDCLPSRIIVT